MHSDSSFLDLVCCADARYAQPVAALLASVVENTRDPGRCRLWLVTNAASEQSFGAVAEVAKATGASIVTRVIEDRELPAPAAGSYYTKASMYRILFPGLLPEQVTRALYLDSDIIVRADVAELFALELADNYIVAAVNNAGGSGPAIVPAGVGYFNAGLLLIDLVKWRKQRLEEKLLIFARTHESALVFYDQDALNAVIAGAWLPLDPRWNQQYEHFLVAPEVTCLDVPVLRQVQKNPFAVHFSGASKPWHFRDDHPFKTEYFYYLDKTLFRGWRPRASGWRDWLRYLGRKPVPFRVRPWLHGIIKLKRRSILVRQAEVHRG